MAQAAEQLPFKRLSTVYEILIENLLEDVNKNPEHGLTRMQKRWYKLLYLDGVWPEIVSRQGSGFAGEWSVSPLFPACCSRLLSPPG